MASPSKIDDAGRAIAGLLGYNPGPGIYSRLERAVQQMPSNVRVEELPGLLKRYKEGVPGWELNETDLPGLIGDAKVIPRQDLLDRVRERSPVFTHREIVLKSPGPADAWDGIDGPSKYQSAPSLFGRGINHGAPKYQAYGQGGDDYTEIILTQPWDHNDTETVQDQARDVGHWAGWGNGPAISEPLSYYHAAHARFDTHGDALRINELQSDRGIHNRRAREWQASNPGEEPTVNVQELNFPLEDAWSDILIKRLALEAAQKGHRAIEIASPRAIADQVGGNIDNYEHFYGKVIPGALERLGRKMGGLTDVTPSPGPSPAPGYEAALDAMRDGSPDYGQRALQDAIEALRIIRDASPRGPRPAFGEAPSVAWNRLAAAYGGDGDIDTYANLLHGALWVDMARGGGDASRATEMMPQLVRLAENHAAAMDRYRRVDALATEQRVAAHYAPQTAAPPGRRYIMSDEMRKRILTQGIGASLLAPVVMEGEE